MTIETIAFGGTEYQYETLGNYGAPELAKIFNKAAAATGGSPVKRFSDKATALKRTWAAIKAATETAPTGTDATVATAPSELVKPKPHNPDTGFEKALKEERKPKAAKKEAAPKKARVNKGGYFHFKARDVDNQKVPKKDTMRGKLFQLLSREHGATFDQLFAATWGNEEMRSAAGCDDMTEETQRKTTYEGTRLIHYFNGFGLYHDAKDHVHVWSTKADYEALIKSHPPKHDASK